MTFTKKEMLQYLQKHDIDHTLYEHEPFMTVEQGLSIVESMNIPGMIIKNLFLKDDRNSYLLVSATADTKINLKELSKTLQRKNLRFAKPTYLSEYLGVQPGSVTPLALINDQRKAVDLIIDSYLLEQEYIQIHPLQNDATVVMTPNELVKFLNLIDKTYNTHNFA